MLALLTTTAAFGLVMLTLDLLTSTTPLHHLKGSTMFTLTVSVDGIESTEVYATRSDAVTAAIYGSNELDVSLIGLYGSESDHAGEVFDTFGYTVGTWSITDSADVAEDTLNAQLATVTGDAEVFLIDVDMDSGPWADVDPSELLSILTEADLDGWADDDNFAEDHDYLDAVYSEHDDWSDDYADAWL